MNKVMKVMVAMALCFVMGALATTAQAITLYEEDWESYNAGDDITAAGYTLATGDLVGTGYAVVTQDGLFGVGNKAIEITNPNAWAFYDISPTIAADMTGVAGNIIRFEADVYFDAVNTGTDAMTGMGSGGSSAAGLMANWAGGTPDWLWVDDGWGWTGWGISTGITHISTEVDLTAGTVTHSDGVNTLVHTPGTAFVAGMDLTKVILGSYRNANLTGFDNILMTQTPEPATLALLALGSGVLIRKRRTRS